MSEIVPTDDQCAAIFRDADVSGGNFPYALIRAGYAAARASAQEPVAVLPDSSAFFTASFPLPADHWLYAPRGGWDSVRDEYAECPLPILTHEVREQVVAAIRYAIRGATNCGKEQDLDPDALVQKTVYALCGPFSLVRAAPPAAPVEPPALAGLREAIRNETRIVPPASAAVAAWTPHIIQEGSRKHVISYHGTADGAKEVCNVPNCEINKGKHHDDESDSGRPCGLAGEGDEGVLQTGRGNRAGGCDRASEHGAGLPHPQQYADPCGGNAARVADATPAAVEALRELVALEDSRREFDHETPDEDFVRHHTLAKAAWAAARAVLQSLTKGGEGKS